MIAVWEIVPEYMFPLLSGFSIFCLADNGRHDVMRKYVPHISAPTTTCIEVLFSLFGGASNNEGTGLLA